MKASPGIIVHGGAGGERDDGLQTALDGCRMAASGGWRILTDGGTALAAVEAAVTILEDNPAFNAGTGAVLNREGRVELDASIMDGSSLRVGAVAVVRRIRNPIQAARLVMENTTHVLLAASGAERLAQTHGIPLIDEQDLVRGRQYERWRTRHGTVGCVAFDSQNHIAAGTSTGGRFDALPGRVGDSPLIGAGTYANGSGGISCTGIGEDIIRTVLARRAAELLADVDAPAAARRSIESFTRHTHSEAGLIIIDAAGSVGYYHNTAHMPVCIIDREGERVAY